MHKKVSVFRGLKLDTVQKQKTSQSMSDFSGL